MAGMDEQPFANPYLAPQAPLIDPPPATRPRRRWRKIISYSIFAGLFLTAGGWSWYGDKFVIAMVCLTGGLIIRFWPLTDA